METGFVLLQPITLVAAGTLFLTLPAFTPGVGGHRRRWLLPGVYLLLAAVLLLADGPVADALLALLTAAAAGWFAFAYYARPVLPLSRSQRTICGICRGLALITLLILLGRPAWNAAFREWHRPLLVALLDHSESIGLRDQTAGPEAATRAEQAAAVLRRESAALAQLESFYEVRRRTIAADPRPLDAWRLEPRDPQTELAAALRRAGLERSTLGQTPHGVLVLSDGAENVAEPAAVVAAGRALAEREVPILAVGVGPSPDETPGILLEPLRLPSEIGLREELAVDVVAHTFGCGGQSVAVELAWDEPFDVRRRRIAGDRESISESFRATPPRPGLLRLTARVTLPPVLGGDSFETSQIVRVRNQEIRVLYLDRQPSSELAFVSRALRSDPRFNLTVALRAEDDTATLLDWGGYDVVLLGRVRLSRAETTALVDAVRERGTGLLLAGGAFLLNDPQTPRGELGDVAPAAFVLRTNDPREIEARLTPRGTRHEVLHRLLDNDNLPALPPLVGGARLGPAGPLAETLLVDDRGAPLLLTHEVGRGRCGLATWESTWAWALGTEDGPVWHAQFWRQLVNWLANRRPQAWVLPDSVRYGLRGLRSGSRRIEIQAGVSGVETGPFRTARWDLKLTMARDAETDTQPTDPPREIPLLRDGERWTATLPAAVPDLAFEPAGYRLDLAATATLENGETLSLTAGSGFFVERRDPELRSPTANLGLLRQAAEQTTEVGGRYVDLDELGSLLAGLTTTDPRQSVSRRTQMRATESYPWTLWAVVVLLLATEWVVRKRVGLP